MYLEIGNDLLIESRAVLGVFDLDNTSWSKRTRAFLEAAQENGELIDAAEELPESAAEAADIAVEAAQEE